MAQPEHTLQDSVHLGTDAGGQLVQRTLVVRVMSGPDAGLEARVERETLIVGSGPRADLVLTDRRASRIHVEIALLAGGVRVRDLGSRNGTFHKDARVGALVLPLGSQIRVGRSELALTLETAPVPLPADAPASFGRLVGSSGAMRRVFAMLARVAAGASPVLLIGEAGTGKSAAARALHEASARPGPVVSLDLTRAHEAAALEASFDAAEQGTLVLEHLDRAGVETWAALRRTLEQREDAGGVRTITTAREDLRALVEEGRLDRDLYYFVGGVAVHLPPLRERVEDVPVLLASFGLARPPDEAALAEERARGFPANVRGLRNVAEAFAAPGHAELEFKDAKQRAVDDFEREFVRSLLEQHDGNVSAAARAAGMSRSHLVSLVAKHGLGS